MSTIGDNWARIAARVSDAAIEAGRPPEDVRLVAVSKAHPAEAVADAFHAGARDFGESYVQEMTAKRADVSALLGPEADAIRWHYMGRLQRNKVGALGDVALIHSVDRLKLLQALDRRAETPRHVLLQVHLGGEDSKAGFDAGDVLSVAEQAKAMPGIVLRGLMTIPPPMLDEDTQRQHFARLRALLTRCQDALGEPSNARADHGLRELSMGMSSDFALAIQEGATLVRVGTAIFGQRRPA